MVETLLLGGIAGLLVAVIASVVVLKIQQHSLYKTSIQQQGWEKAQETRQQQWQLQQEKRSLILEKSLSVNVHEVQHEWQEWEQKDAQREQELKHQYKALTEQTTTANIVKRLPFLEEASLPPTENQLRRESLASSTPAQLQNADLTKYDLSRRYLGNANLRGANLSRVNLFMSDLSGACLMGADLTHADLSGANLVNADLRGANLTGANLLVADLNDAILLKANLQKVRNLTPGQLQTTVHDGSALLNTESQPDEEEDITQPRLPAIPTISTIPAMATNTTNATTHATTYDIVQAQCLDALPEAPTLLKTEEISQPTQSSQFAQTPFLMFPEILPETPFQVGDEAMREDENSVTASSIPDWTSEDSQETLRMLEELHFPGQDYSNTEDFGSKAQEIEREELPHVRAS